MEDDDDATNTAKEKVKTPETVQNLPSVDKSAVVQSHESSESESKSKNVEVCILCRYVFNLQLLFGLIESNLFIKCFLLF
jgi:hypothetical protein